MDLYIYETPGGHVADFRPYLDGRDHACEDHREIGSRDPRQEKISSLRDPQSGRSIAGSLRFVGTSSVEWKELMTFPIAWDREFEASDWRP